MEVLRDWYPGKYVKEVESYLANIYGGHAVAVNSGTSALQTALAGVGVRAGDVVITPAYTFAAPAYAVLQMGGVPTFADIDPLTWNVCPETIEPLITDKTTAIVVVHLYGLPADMRSIMELADYYNLKVIEDCAEAFMASIDGRYVGSFGDAAIFSFEKSKHITCGNGGAVVFRNPYDALKGRKFSCLGYTCRHTKEDLQHPEANRHYVMGYNFKMPELCAAVLVPQLEDAESLVDMRIQAGKKFAEVVDLYPTLNRQMVFPGIEHSYWTFAFALTSAFGGSQSAVYEEFRERFLANGGDTFYAGWKPVPNEPFFAAQGYSVWDLPMRAMALQPRLVCMNTGYDEKEADRQAEILYKTLGEML